MLSPSDTYVVASLHHPRGGAAAAADHQKPLASAKWPVKWDATHPAWYSARLLHAAETPHKDAYLRFVFYDYDSARTSQLIGVAECAAASIADRATLKLPIRRADGRALKKRPYCVVARAPPPPPGRRRTLFLIRHGESVWNEAQANHNAVAMLSDTDHPLNAAGRAQAESLRDALSAEAAEAAASEGGPSTTSLLSVQAVMCSPLTRALETCLIALSPILVAPAVAAAVAPPAVLLNPNLREKRNFGGRDSSGKNVGEAVRAGVRRALASLYADEPQTARRLGAIPLELQLVHDRWWKDSAEAEAHVEERLDDLLAQLYFGDAESVALVGHSHLFRELFRLLLGGGADGEAAGGRGAGEAGAGESAVASATGLSDELELRRLSRLKLCNAGVVRVELEWPACQPTGGRPRMTCAQLVYGSQLV